MYADNDTTNWDNVSIAEKARIGYSFNGADGTFFMTKEQFNLNFASVSWSPKLEGWTRSYFLKIDDTFVNPGKNVYGGSKYTRHEFYIISDVDQSAIFTINTHAIRSYPWNTCMSDSLNAAYKVRNVIEYILPGSSTIK